MKETLEEMVVRIIKEEWDGSQTFDDEESWKDSFPSVVKFKDLGRGMNAVLGTTIVGTWDDSTGTGKKYDLEILDKYRFK